MRRRLLDILACPVCKHHPLILEVTREGEEVIEGKLVCPGCGAEYAIRDAIPDMIPPSR